MERWVRKRFIRDFLRLPEQKQREVLELMREFERAREMKKEKCLESGKVILPFDRPNG